MTHNLDDILDDAIAHQKENNSFTGLLDDYPASKTDLMQFLEITTTLATLQTVELPPASDMLADRQAFIDQIAYYQPHAQSTPIPLVVPLRKRINLWWATAVGWVAGSHFFKEKETRTMIPVMARFMIILTLALGTIGGTAVAANNSLPDSPIYPFKLAFEEAQLTLTTNQAEEAELHLRLAEARLTELEQMALQNYTSGDNTLVQLEDHLTMALQLAAQLPESEMNGVLLQAQHMAQTRTRTMFKAQSDTPPPMLGEAHQLMHQFGKDVDEGLAYPATFRWRYTDNHPDTAPEQPAPEPPGPGGVITPTQGLQNKAGDCVNGNCGPLNEPNQQQGPPEGAPNPNPNPEPDPDPDPEPEPCVNADECGANGTMNQFGDSEEPAPYGNRNGTEDEPAGELEQNQNEPGPYGPPAEPPNPEAPPQDPGCTEQPCDPTTEENNNPSTATTPPFNDAPQPKN